MKPHILSTKTILALLGVVIAWLGLAGCGSIQAASMGSEPAGTLDGGGIGSLEIGIEPTPTPTMLTYSNPEYGFKFDYPQTWVLTPEDQSLILEKGPNRLVISFGWAQEGFPPGLGSGLPAGDFIYAGKVDFIGQVIPVEVLLYDSKSKAVYFNQTTPIRVEDLVFIIVLEDQETEYTQVDLPEGVIAEAAGILETFERIEALGSPEAGSETPAGEATGEMVDSRGSAGFPGSLTRDEARALIQAHLQAQDTTGKMGELSLQVDEIPFRDALALGSVQLFRITDGLYRNQTYLIEGERVVQLGETAGGRGLTSLAISDLDTDMQPELLFTYSAALSPGAGAGEQSRVGVYAPAYDPIRTFEADFAYLGDLTLSAENATTVHLIAADFNPDLAESGYQGELGRLSILQQPAGPALELALDPDLPPEIEQSLLKNR
jgi:hypothetical protein